MSRQNNTLLTPLVFGMLVNAILFYSNAYWLIPKYLLNRHLKKYSKWSILFLLGLTGVELTFDVLYIIQTFLKDSLNALPPSRRWSGTLELIMMFGAMDLIINITFWAAAFLYRLPKDWMKNERQKQQLIQDRLTAELDFLKAQINPHFLFNGINSIYHLMEEDVQKAQRVLVRFSELLRYQLYECKEDYIPLTKELQYVANYLEIESIRKGEDAMVAIDMPELNNLGDSANSKIAPLLFSPFLENAFKYLSLYSERERNILAASISTQDNIIRLLVKNSVDSMAQSKSINRSSGIGLENVKRRLNLLYPNSHQLSIQENAGCFFVDLKIDLK